MLADALQGSIKRPDSTGEKVNEALGLSGIEQLQIDGTHLLYELQTLMVPIVNFRQQ